MYSARSCLIRNIRFLRTYLQTSPTVKRIKPLTVEPTTEETTVTKLTPAAPAGKLVDPIVTSVALVPELEASTVVLATSTVDGLLELVGCLLVVVGATGLTVVSRVVGTTVVTVILVVGPVDKYVVGDVYGVLGRGVVERHHASLHGNRTRFRSDTLCAEQMNQANTRTCLSTLKLTLEVANILLEVKRIV